MTARHPLTVDGLTFERWLPQVACAWCGHRVDGKPCGRQANVAGVLPEGHKWSAEGLDAVLLCNGHLLAWQKHNETNGTMSLLDLFRHIARTRYPRENAGKEGVTP